MSYFCLQRTNPHSSVSMSTSRDPLFTRSDLDGSVTPVFRKTLTNFENESAPENHNKLKLVNGVIVPCMLHMMGILFFLKIGWAVGKTGWLATLLYCFFICQ